MSSVVGMSTWIRIVRCSLYVTLALLMLIKEKTGATNSSAFQQLPADIKKSVLIELKGKRASLRQLERLTEISKSMTFVIKKLISGIRKFCVFLFWPQKSDKNRYHTVEVLEPSVIFDNLSLDLFDNNRDNA